VRGALIAAVAVALFACAPASVPAPEVTAKVASPTVGSSTTAAAGGAPTAGSATASTGATAPAAAGAGAPKGTAPTAAPTAEPVTSTATLATDALPRATFTSGDVRAQLPIEVPPEKEYGIGLSGRLNLQGRGMLFAFPDGQNVGFWMKNTHVDLDIAFIDASMKVITVTTMRADTLDIHKPAGAYVAAVEAPAGWYAQNKIGVGATASLPVDLRAATGR